MGADSTKFLMATADLLPLLREVDLEQIRLDTQRLQAENNQLKQRVAALESQMIAGVQAACEVH